jgi:hypothetical protein
MTDVADHLALLAGIFHIIWHGAYTLYRLMGQLGCFYTYSNSLHDISLRDFWLPSRFIRCVLSSGTRKV